jgi:predicted anti-sigma-YlaC factor YlaD
MKCTHARRLFPAFWDDETTQAEREWLEAHFTACPACRREYESYARTLELVGSLPRIEPAPDLAERALARARRAETAPDRLPVSSPQWVPITAAAVGLVLITLTIAGPWLGAIHTGDPTARSASVRQPVLVPVPEPTAVGAPAERGGRATMASGAPLSDSLFDHSEDVEFVLDPVTLHRGRASLSRGTTQGERAVITF